MNQEQKPKEDVFAIRIPREATSDVSVLLNWVVNSLSPSLPLNLAKTSSASVEGFFNLVRGEVARFTSFISYKARCEAQGYVPDDAEHAKWLSVQNLELHVREIGPGSLAAQLKLFGPSTVASSFDPLSIGYEDLASLFIRLYYLDDSYTVDFLDNSKIGSAAIPVGARSAYSKPILNIDLNQGEKRVGCKLLVETTMLKLKEEIDKEFSTDVAIDSTVEAFLDTFLKATFDISGGFFDPHSYKVVAYSLPTKGGVNVYTMITVAYGRQYTTALPIIKVENV